MKTVIRVAVLGLLLGLGLTVSEAADCPDDSVVSGTVISTRRVFGMCHPGKRL